MVGVPRRSTLADVARAAGTSTATASRVLNGSSLRGVTPQLSARVRDAAASVGYRADPCAQALVLRRSPLVALVVHGLDDVRVALAVAELARALVAAGRVPVLGVPDDRDPPGERTAAAVARTLGARHLVTVGTVDAGGGVPAPVPAGEPGAPGALGAALAAHLRLVDAGDTPAARVLPGGSGGVLVRVSSVDAG